ncbi:MAG: hypothetical protein FJ030_16960 [Chloroflexi bacterium]|nr:hypothetical protein [Chloroflexota bacterium]
MPPKLDRDLLRQTLAGYAEVNRITEAERRARLKTMTDAESRVIFDDLCATWERLGKSGGDWERVNRWRIEQKIALRQAFERLARAKGLI